jgi:hypothetical protein
MVVTENSRSLCFADAKLKSHGLEGEREGLCFILGVKQNFLTKFPSRRYSKLSIGYVEIS